MLVIAISGSRTWAAPTRAFPISSPLFSALFALHKKATAGCLTSHQISSVRAVRVRPCEDDSLWNISGCGEHGADVGVEVTETGSTSAAV